MLKVIAVIFCIFCSFVFVKAQAEEEAVVECFMQYHTYDPPDECSTVIDEYGETEEFCNNNGSSLANAILNADESSFAEEYFSLESLWWSGTCNCVLTLYKETNARGCHVRQRFNNEEHGQIDADDILVQRSNSFSVKCIF